jgi:RecA/RadA recombinase
MVEEILGDEDVLTDPEKFKRVEQEALQSAESIEKSVKITDKDIEKAKTTKTGLSEEAEIKQLQEDLAGFISDKVLIDNDTGGIIERFPTGIDLLDAIAGGGFGVGTFTMIIGNPGTFKSALLASTIAAGQRKFNGRMLATFHDSESSMSTERLSNLGVVKPTLKPYDDVTVESIFKTIEAISAFKEIRKLNDYPSIIAWDSIANTSTEKERTTDDINATIGLKARLLSALFPRYLPKLKANKISLIAVNQLREKLDMGQFAAPSDLQHMGNKDIPGGQALKFNAFHLLFLRNRGDLKVEQYGFSGIRLEAFFIKNKFFRPYVSVNLLVDFNIGVSNFWTNYNFLVENNRLTSGAWNFLVSYPEKKFRTKDAIETYNTDKKFKDLFDKEVKDTINREIVQKYTS